MQYVHDYRLDPPEENEEYVTCPHCGRAIEINEVCDCYKEDATLERCLMFINEQPIIDKKLFYVDYCFGSDTNIISDELYNLCRNRVEEIIKGKNVILPIAKDYIRTNLSWSEYKEWVEE